MLNPVNVIRILKTRGILAPSNDSFRLIDELDGQGIKIDRWDEATLGARPSQAELVLANAPQISLGITANNTDDGIIVTATLTGGATQTVNWRCIDPDGLVNTASGAAVAGVETWEIITGKAGQYIIQAWADAFGFAEVEYLEA